ncbi:hypothetical protein [Candidatus Francisella endociliophora]|uniref:hypothetical protein n=1 Tax=Candidatus Francisella endociliophora TaxID=653937 RepID=UPI000AF162CB|nr:hypothetical protein [Francisella sp. FSC1006]
MKKILGFILLVVLLNGCTFYNRDVRSSPAPLVKRQHSVLIKNKTNNNKELFDLFRY